MIASAQKDRFSTKVHSLYTLGTSRYLIPSYQRPYVWATEQVLKLLDDFWVAFNKNGNESYFIGTILTSVNDGKEELIDGQQRFTTLWLLALAFKNIGEPCDLTNFLKANGQLRLDFAIREKLKDYLTLLIEDKALAIQKFSSKEIEDDEYLINVARAVSTIEGWLLTKRREATSQMADFGNHIYRKIQFVKNTTPSGTDLNKLFTTINNSGVQLEQTDILKAKLLKYIKTDKEKYSKIWEACENMENYFERNIFKLFPQSDKFRITPDGFRKFDSDIFLFKPVAEPSEIATSADAGVLLQNILNSGEGNIMVSADGTHPDYNADSDTDNVVYCESILSFGQLLLHAYRGFLFRNGVEDFNLPFHVKNLISIFKGCDQKSGKKDQSSEEHIKSFFEYLWEVRFLFDKYVVKWISEPGEKDKNLVLTNLNKDVAKNQFSRARKEKDNSSMLQSVLYFTTNYNTQIWLSPFLKQLAEDEDALQCLESIDNELSLSKLEDKETTYALMCKGATIDQKNDYAAYLKNSLAHPFKHYWFQKLEYILWKNWTNKADVRFQNYRITSKNSVEHISPRNPEYGDKLESGVLNSFGNLALLNVRQNSSYSNQFVSKKKIDFDNKKDAYDSLKLAYVYGSADKLNWNKDEIEKHQELMINAIINHYKYQT